MINPFEDYKLDYNRPESLRNYFDFAGNPESFGTFIGYEYGFDTFVRNFLLGEILMPIYVQYKDPNFILEDLCMMLFYAQGPAVDNCKLRNYQKFLQF